MRTDATEEIVSNVMTESIESLEPTQRRRIFDGPPTVVAVSLATGDQIPAHEHPGQSIVFTVLEGIIELDVDDETHTLHPWEVARFDGSHTISVTAISRSTALIILSPK